ncbi:hypothetical protein [Streptosporangium roseum]|uniref:hypothetical protein n=1 Tax=Streptosporangium roseum TaxID=2001 RepID=UPI0033308A38
MFVVAAVTLCGVLTVLNLILTLGVIRRLRDHTDRLGDLAQARPMPDPIIVPGSRPAAFAADTVDAEPITEAHLAGGGLVAFFSPTCGACEEWIPRFATAARALPDGRRRALAVVVAPAEADAAGMVAKLRDAAMVVVEEDKGPLATAFKVFGYPAMCRLGEDGTVVSSGKDAVTVPVTA